MTGFELQTSGVGSDRSTNCATTTSHHDKFFFDRIADYVPTLIRKESTRIRTTAHVIYQVCWPQKRMDIIKKNDVNLASRLDAKKCMRRQKFLKGLRRIYTRIITWRNACQNRYNSSDSFTPCNERLCVNATLLKAPISPYSVMQNIR